MHIHIHIHIHIHTYIYIYISYTCTYIYIYIYIYMYLYMYTHIHTYMYVVCNMHIRVLKVVVVYVSCPALEIWRMSPKMADVLRLGLANKTLFETCSLNKASAVGTQRITLHCACIHTEERDRIYACTCLPVHFLCLPSVSLHLVTRYGLS